MARLKRILRIIASADLRSGGPIEGIIRTSEVLLSRGCHTDIVCLDKPGQFGATTHPVRVFPVGSGPIQYKYSPHFESWLNGHLNEYDVAIVHGLWNYASLGSYGPLRRSGIPYFVYTHGMLDPWFNVGHPFKQATKQLLWLLSEGRLLSGARAVLFTADEERRLARRAFWGYRYREQVVGYGTTEPPYDRKQQITVFENKVPSITGKDYILFLSRIHEKKGCDLLIRAFSEVAPEFPSLHLVMAGPSDAALLARLRQEVELAGLASRVHWTGMLTGDAKWGAIRRASAFILPSHQENFGIVLAEAMACGVQVLTTNKVNIWREIESSGAGLIGTDNQSGVSGLLRRFLGQSEDEMEMAKSMARRAFETNFNIANTAPRLYEFLERLASS